MNAKKLEIKPYQFFEKILHLSSALFFPSVFLFNLYNRNRYIGELHFFHILLLAGILGIANVFVFLLIRFITKQYEVATLISILFWLFFWMFEAISLALPTYNQILVLVGGCVFFLCLITAFGIKKVPLHKGRIFFNVVAGIACILFAFNAIPSFISNWIMNSPSGFEQQSSAFTIRREFNVELALPSPDIYWIHVDGALGFDAMLEFFDDPQDELRQELNSRGFVINEHAYLYADVTDQAIPALFSPDLHDSFLGEILIATGNALRDGTREYKVRRFREAGFSPAEHAAPYLELFHAFLQAGYRTVTIAEYAPTRLIPIDIFYRLGNESYPLAVTNSEVYPRGFWRDAAYLIDLLTYTTPLPPQFVYPAREGQRSWEVMPTHDALISGLTEETLNFPHERQLFRRVIDTFLVEEPKFVFIEAAFWHANRWHWHDDTLTLSWENRAPTRVYLYPTAHAYGMEFVLTLIDLILDSNENAVIVIQSDHGFHLRDTHEQLLADGFSFEEVVMMNNSVMSAVRIPEQHGGLGAPLNPLNIARELVNRFVGPNYQLLPE